MKRALVERQSGMRVHSCAHCRGLIYLWYHSFSMLDSPAVINSIASRRVRACSLVESALGVFSPSKLAEGTFTRKLQCDMRCLTTAEVQTNGGKAIQR